MRLALSLVRARRDLALKVPPSGQSLEFFNVAREQHASNPALLPILLVHLGHLIHNALANILLQEALQKYPEQSFAQKFILCNRQKFSGHKIKEGF